jgi:hypothetical protein
MAWSSVPEEQRKIDEIERWDRAALRPHRIPTPSCLEHESFDGLRKRLINKVRPYVSEDLQKVKTDDVFGSGLDHMAQQFLASVAAEALRPTKIPEGRVEGGYKVRSKWPSIFRVFWLTIIMDERILRREKIHQEHYG